MNDSGTEPGRQRRIALVAHDARKQDMREWAEFNRDLLARHQLYATGTGRRPRPKLTKVSRRLAA